MQCTYVSKIENRDAVSTMQCAARHTHTLLFAIFQYLAHRRLIATVDTIDHLCALMDLHNTRDKVRAAEREWMASICPGENNKINNQANKKKFR